MAWYPRTKRKKKNGTKKSTEWRRNDGMEPTSSSHALLVGSKRSNPFFSFSYKEKKTMEIPPSSSHALLRADFLY
jgi:hypothetical protein